MGNEKMVKLKKKWCLCSGDEDAYSWIAKTGDRCSCGYKGQHYHCKECGGITQTG